MEIKVGNWVLVESKMVGGVCHRQPFLVTKIAGNRIYIVPCDKEYRDGKFHYIQDVDHSGETFKAKHKIVFVFTTFDGAKKAGAKIDEQWHSWWNGHTDLKRKARAVVYDIQDTE